MSWVPKTGDLLRKNLKWLSKHRLGI